MAYCLEVRSLELIDLLNTFWLWSQNVFPINQLIAELSGSFKLSIGMRYWLVMLCSCSNIQMLRMKSQLCLFLIWHFHNNYLTRLLLFVKPVWHNKIVKPILKFLWLWFYKKKNLTMHIDNNRSWKDKTDTTLQNCIESVLHSKARKKIWEPKVFTQLWYCSRYWILKTFPCV